MFEKKEAINYLYDGMPWVKQHISNTKPPEKYCQSTYVTVVTMEQIVGSVFENNSSIEKRFIYELIIYLEKIYVKLSGEEVLPEVQQS